nr:thioredoxin domain containing protein 15 [Hymenolepis microstoma]
MWNESSPVKDSPSDWSKNIDGSERNDNILIRCRLRPINYWNYTEGQAKTVLGHQFESAIGMGQHYLSTSHDIFGVDREVPIHRHKRRLFSFFNPFFLSPTESQSQGSNNYVLVNKKRKSENNSQSPARRERLVVDSQCSLVFIYARWCPFSMALAPSINALARAFPQLPVIAIDVDEYLRYRWSLRVFYVPKLKIFVGDNVYREFNGTDTGLNEMVDFVWRHLRIMPQGPVELRRSDFLGPIPNQLLIRKTDERFLSLVWTIFFLSILYFVTSCLDWRKMRQHLSAVLKSLGHLLDHQDYRSERRNAAAYAVLPSLPPPPPISIPRTQSSVSASTSTEFHPHAD